MDVITFNFGYFLGVLGRTPRRGARLGSGGTDERSVARVVLQSSDVGGEAMLWEKGAISNHAI